MSLQRIEESREEMTSREHEESRLIPVGHARQPEGRRKAGVLRRFLEWQQRLSAAIDRLLPDFYRVDGAYDFLDHVVPDYIPRGALLYDVGGGKHPVLSPEKKAAAGIKIVGLDIDADELSQAPAGSYDRIVCSDIAAFRGNSDADVVLCASVIEHVRDTRAALRSVSSILRPGGRAVFYVPCKNAIFARLNLLIPEKVKRALLWALVPKSRGYCGFPAFYDQCTPAEFERAAKEAGLEVERIKLYWYSPYFTFFAPAFLLWRGWVLLSRAIAGGQVAEAFAIVLKRVR